MAAQVVIVVTMAIASAVAVGLVMLLPDQYRVTTILRVQTPTEGGWANTPYADRLNNTYLAVIRSDTVMIPLMEQLDLDAPPKVDLGAVPNTELLELTVEGRDPQVVNTLADLLIENNRAFYYGETTDSSIAIQEELDRAIEELTSLYNEFNLIGDNPVARASLEVGDRVLVETAERRVNDLQARYDETVLEEQRQATSITVLQYAEPPDEPYAPNRMLMIILGVAVAGVASLGMAFVFENLDNKLYTSRQIQDITGSLPLAHIPMAGELRKQVKGGVNSIALENFRTLRTNLFAMIGLDKQNKSIVVTSADPKEGKSTVTAFLGAVIAQAGSSVIVVDGDMRLSRQHDLYGVDNSKGLSNLLSGEMDLDDVIQHSESAGVDVIPGGPVPANAAELVASERMIALLDELKSRYDVVLVDSPAMTVVADATQLATLTDGVINIVTRHRSTRGGVRRALDQLDQVGANLLGVVINNAEKKSMQSYYHAIAKNQAKSSTPPGGGRPGKGTQASGDKGAAKPEIKPEPATATASITDDEQLAGGTTTA
ncbi:polysaccharide biosynthesis tyrosine autokinase [bacterium]|nr:polysaccharide biosynthesis tyrosine autokinase [bacterium]